MPLTAARALIVTPRTIRQRTGAIIGWSLGGWATTAAYLEEARSPLGMRPKLLDQYNYTLHLIGCLTGATENLSTPLVCVIK